jgi:rhodanese-related sulfurtransferase
LAEIKPVSPEEAAELLDSGWVYVDVRSEPEFEAGHVPGALNVPLLHKGPAGMTPNADFLSVMERAFGKEEKLIVGCRSGGRSRRAAEMLTQAGFSNVCDMVSGWEGSRDAFGRLVPGWSAKRMPAESGNPEGQSYEAVKSRQPK